MKCTQCGAPAVPIDILAGIVELYSDTKGPPLEVLFSAVDAAHIRAKVKQVPTMPCTSLRATSTRSRPRLRPVQPMRCPT